MAVDLAFSMFTSKIGQSSTLLTPISILHGLLGSKANWQSVGRRLSVETDKTVYCLDVRNHGDSPRAPNMSFDVMSEDVRRFIEKHELNKSVILGHSMGGKIAMSFALQYPNLVDKLIVVDVAPVKSQGAMEVMNYTRILKNMDLSKIKNRREADSYLKEKIHDDILRQFLVSGLEVDKKTGVAKWKSNLQALEDNMAELTDFPHYDDSDSFTGPTLFIGGGNSPYISDDVIPSIHRLFPGAIVSHIEGAGHWPHLEKSNEFVQLIKEFL